MISREIKRNEEVNGEANFLENQEGLWTERKRLVEKARGHVKVLLSFK